MKKSTIAKRLDSAIVKLMNVSFSLSALDVGEDQNKLRDIINDLDGHCECITSKLGRIQSHLEEDE